MRERGQDLLSHVPNPSRGDTALRQLEVFHKLRRQLLCTAIAAPSIPQTSEQLLCTGGSYSARWQLRQSAQASSSWWPVAEGAERLNDPTQHRPIQDAMIPLSISDTVQRYSWCTPRVMLISREAAREEAREPARELARERRGGGRYSLQLQLKYRRSSAPKSTATPTLCFERTLTVFERFHIFYERCRDQ